MWNRVPHFKEIKMKANDNFEYKMTTRLYEEYLKGRKGKNKNLDPQTYLCQIINEEYGIKGTCVKVLTF